MQFNNNQFARTNLPELLDKKRAGFQKKSALDLSLISVLSPQLNIVEQQLASL